MLNVLAPSPPVPTTSVRSVRCGRTGTTCSRSDGDAAGDLRGRLALGAQRHQEPGHLGRVRVAAHDDAHRLVGAVEAEVLAGDELLEVLLHAVSSRKFRSSRGPSGVRIDSGWNCTPCVGAVAVAHRHHLAVGGARGQQEVGRAAARWRPASGSGRPRTRRRGPRAAGRRPPPATMPALPCTSRWACVTVPPCISASSWWPRQTPRIGTRPCSRSIRSARDAGLGRPAGAGRDARGASAAVATASSAVSSSWRNTSTWAPCSARPCARLYVNES